MPNRNIIAIGTSAGGPDALRFVIGKLSVGFPASILGVMHPPEQPRPLLDTILTRAGALLATFAADGERLEPGRRGAK
jgi:two-component system chemotaxis response regulator CheB